VNQIIIIIFSYQLGLLLLVLVLVSVLQEPEQVFGLLQGVAWRLPRVAYSMMEVKCLHLVCSTS
jgi:hypothetical protein